MHVEFLKDVADVLFDGDFGETELGGDLLVAVALDDEVENAGFAADTFKGDDSGVEKMRDKLDELLRSDPERAVTLKPMPGVVYADIMIVLDTVIEVGYEDVSFAGSYQ